MTSTQRSLLDHAHLLAHGQRAAARVHAAVVTRLRGEAVRAAQLGALGAGHQALQAEHVGQVVQAAPAGVAGGGSQEGGIRASGPRCSSRHGMAASMTELMEGGKAGMAGRRCA